MKSISIKSTVVIRALRHCLLAFSVLCLVSLSACNILYKIDIQQGNEITALMLAELKIGMSKQQVSKVLGFPLINDPFHRDRWDYYFYLKKGDSGDIQQRSATLWFSEDGLSDMKSSLLDSATKK